MEDLKAAFELIKKDILQNKPYYLIVLVLLFFTVFLRVWRIDQIMDFNYDQGRDALVIADLLKGNLVLIGPTTGIEGIFLGPFYYYFLAPGYLIGQGLPAIASVWQTIFIILGYLLIFFMVRFHISKIAAFLVLFFMTFSFQKIFEDRWLSNPVPTFFFIPLAVLFFTQSFKKPLPFLPLAFLCLGITLQLEAASAFFLFLAGVLLVILFRNKYNLKAIFFSVLAFFMTLVPQIMFELKNNFLLTHNLLNFVNGSSGESTFQLPTLIVLDKRVRLFSSVFFEKLKINYDSQFSFLFILFVVITSVLIYKNWQKPFIKVVAILLWVPLFIFIFYHGNQGRIYTYYFIPLIPLFFILLGLIIDYIWKLKSFKYLIIVLALLFLYEQHSLTISKLQDHLDGENTIALGNETAAVRYVIKDAGQNPYNTDVYVPPVIAYPYTYLFKVYGSEFDNSPKDELVSRLYTIHEVDTEMPKRAQDWLKRQEGIGKIQETEKFGGIKVEKRERIF
jgi:hypothetical protein